MLWERQSFTCACPAPSSPTPEPREARSWGLSASHMASPERTANFSLRRVPGSREAPSTLLGVGASLLEPSACTKLEMHRKLILKRILESR